VYKGDRVIIGSYATGDAAEFESFKPKPILVKDDNIIVEHL
jgi:aspartate 1-decarboxylase